MFMHFCSVLKMYSECTEELQNVAALNICCQKKGEVEVPFDKSKNRGFSLRDFSHFSAAALPLLQQEVGLKKQTKTAKYVVLGLCR